MRKRAHLLLAEASPLPPFDPGPGTDVGDAVLARALTGEIVAGLARVFAGQVDFEDAVDTEGLVVEAGYGVWNVEGDVSWVP